MMSKKCSSKHFNSFSLTKSTTEFECELRYCDEVYLYIPNFLQDWNIDSFDSMHFYLDPLLIK